MENPDTSNRRSAMSAGSVVLLPSDALSCWAKVLGSKPGASMGAFDIVRQIGARSWWEAAQARLSTDLSAVLDGIVILATDLSPLQNSICPARFADWLGRAQQLSEKWPPGTVADWSAVLSSREGSNWLVDAAAARCLERTPEAGRLAKWSTLAVDFFAQATGPCAGIPLPPEPGRTFDASHYIHRSICPSAFCELAESAGKLQELATQYNVHWSGSNSSRTSSTSAQLIAGRELLQSLSRFTGLFRELDAGWAVEGSRLAASLSDALLRRRNLHGTPLDPSDDVLHDGLSGQLQTWLVNLSCLPPSPPPAGQAPSIAGSESQLRTPGDRRCEEISNLCSILAEATDASLSSLLRRLQEFVRQHAAVITTGGNPQEGLKQQDQEILTALMLADNLFRQNSNSRQLGSVRLTLRRLLFEGESQSDYLLLDENLVGMPLKNCKHWVDVVGVISNSTWGAGHVAKVRQPGYALKQPPQTVLRSAQVVVSE